MLVLLLMITLSLIIIIPPWLKTWVFCQNTPCTICNYSGGDYAFVLQNLSTYEWSCVYSHTSPNSTVQQLSTVVNKSLDFFIPYFCHNNWKYLNWFPNTLKYYIQSISHFYCHYK
jgi:hypothetical protein